MTKIDHFFIAVIVLLITIIAVEFILLRKQSKLEGYLSESEITIINQ